MPENPVLDAAADAIAGATPASGLFSRHTSLPAVAAAGEDLTLEH